MSKTYASTYLYNKYSEYERNIFNFIMNGEEIMKKDPAFDDIRYDVKRRQVSNNLVRVMDSKNVILLTGNNELPKAFKVFGAKDIKGDKKVKSFIDCTNLITRDGGRYVCSNIDIFIAYLVNAMNTTIYYYAPDKLFRNNTLVESGARCFALLFTNIIDNICKISIMSDNKAKCLYLSSVYFLVNIIERDISSDSIGAIARKISGISSREEDIININVNENSYLNIKFFVETLVKALRLNTSVTTDVIIDKWIYSYGQGTQFALEYYPAFSALLTDTYTGCYINNQRTIEKVVGQNMTEFSKSLLNIGETLA